jgi:hypothetical protein
MRLDKTWSGCMILPLSCYLSRAGTWLKARVPSGRLKVIFAYG